MTRCSQALYFRLEVTREISNGQSGHDDQPFGGLMTAYGIAFNDGKITFWSRCFLFVGKTVMVGYIAENQQKVESNEALEKIAFTGSGRLGRWLGVESSLSALVGVSTTNQPNDEEVN